MTECRQENFWVNESQLSFVSDQVKNSLLAQQSLCLMTIERWSHSFPFRTGQWNTLSPMIVGCISSESRTSSGSPFQKPRFRKRPGFLLFMRGLCFRTLPAKKKSWDSSWQRRKARIYFQSFASDEAMLFKNLINEPISVNIGSFRSDFQKHSKNLRSSRFEGKAERRRLIPSLSIPAKSDKQRLN